MYKETNQNNKSKQKYPQNQQQMCKNKSHKMFKKTIKAKQHFAQNKQKATQNNVQNKHNK